MRFLNSFRGTAGILALCLVLAAFPASSQTIQTVYTIQTVAGGSSIGDGGPAAQALLTQPEGIAIDSRGNIFIADPADHRIRRISPDGVIQSIAGSGIAGFSGDNGPSEAATLNAPYGLCFDRAGNLYVADLGNARVRRIGTDGQITTVAGGGIIPPGGDGDGGMATDAKLSAPRNVATDVNGNLYISDFSAQRVFRVNASGVITTVAGSGVAGFAGDGASALLAKLNYPAGIVVDANGILYIADSGNKRVRTVVQGLIGTATTGALNSPTGLAVDSGGNLYIQDGRSTTLRLGGLGGSANLPLGGGDLAIGTGDVVYATSSHVVKKMIGSTVQVIAGAGTTLFAGDGGPAANTRLNGPTGLYRDYQGNFYFVDAKNLRVRRINNVGIVSTYAGDGQASGANGLLATAVHLAGPLFVAADNRGNVYIADTEANRIRRVAPDGTTSTLAGSDTLGFGGDGWLAIYAQINKPGGMAVDQNDNLYFADTGNHRIRKITPEGLIYTVAGGSLMDSLGDGGAAPQARLANPAGVAFDLAGNLYISDTGNGRIRKVDTKGIITTWGGKLIEPRGLRVTSAGEVLVADTGDHTVRRISTTGQISLVAGTGTRGYSGDGGRADAAALDTPYDVWTDRDGGIFIADYGNNRIRKITSETVIVPDQVVNLSVVNSASLKEQAVAPGELVTIFGAGFGSKDGVTGRPQSDGVLPSTLGGIQVLFDGRPAPLLYVQDSQINLQVPYGLAGKSQTEISVVSGTAVKAKLTVAVAPVSLGLFPAALNEDGSANSAQHPAKAGSVVVFYATGDGTLLSDSVDGRPGGMASFRSEVSAEVGGLAAEILYAGRAPGLIGMMQVNLRLSPALKAGSGLPVMLKVNGGTSQSGVTLAVN